MIEGIRKKGPKIIALLTILALVVMAFPMIAFNNAQAAQMQNVKDVISDSDVSATGVTHSFYFTTANAIPAGGELQLIFDTNFDLSSASAQCPGGGTASVSSTEKIVHCHYSSALSAGNLNATVTSATNPSSEDSYLMQIKTFTSTGTEVDSGEARVAIVNSVTVTAHVPATLTFTISGVDASTTVETGKTNVTSTTTTIEFGTVNAGTQYVAAQRLEVHTNANYGFSVKVWQDQNLTNAMSNDINKFKDGSTSTPQAWASPTATLGSANTYGHFGLRSDDDDNDLLYAGQSVSYGTSDWVGFPGDGTGSQVEVFKYNGPTDGSTQHTGWEYVEYSLEISALQEAGDYSNTLTYICTPEY